MRFKKPKQDVLQEIQNRASAVAYNHLQYINNSINLSSNGQNSFQLNTANLSFTIQQAIAMAIEEGFRVMIENQYTDDDFENDVGLTK